MLKAHTVVVILEAKPGKELELMQALSRVIKPSRAEDTCLEYRLHRGKNNLKQFILYENWKSQAAHQEQFNKPYILELIKEIEALLEKPYQAFFAEELEYQITFSTTSSGLCQ